MTPRWYFDIISPFAYLQWRRLRRDHPAFRFQPVPILLAGLLDHWGQLGPAEIPAKRLHTYRIALWDARRLGLPLRLPPTHPFLPIPALRLIIAAGTTAHAIDTLFTHVWEHGHAADTAQALQAPGDALGIADVTAAISDPVVKRQLIENGREAIARGVFGVPTLAFGHDLFWGNDATGFALAYAHDPEATLDTAMRAVDALPQGVQRKRTLP